MSPPQRDGHDGTEGKPEVQHAILPREEAGGADSAPDYTRAVEDLRPPTRPLPCWVDLGAVEVGPLRAQDGLQGYVCC